MWLIMRHLNGSIRYLQSCRNLYRRPGSVRSVVSGLNGGRSGVLVPVRTLRDFSMVHADPGLPFHKRYLVWDVFL